MVHTSHPSEIDSTKTGTILITGAAGFLGSHVIGAWQDRQIVGVDDLSRPASRNRVDSVRKACKAFHTVRAGAFAPQLVQDTSLVLHLAAQVGLSESWDDPADDYERNAGDTWKLLVACSKLPEPPQFVLISSNKVYGDPAPIDSGIDESTALDPESPYALSKVSAEQMVSFAHASGWVRGIILRCSCLYGPGQNGTESQGWISHFVRCALDGTALRIHGSGDQLRDVLHVKDWLNCVERAIACQSDEVLVLNVGGGPADTTSPLLLWQHLAVLTNKNLPAPPHTPRRTGDQDWFVSDISKAKQILGWQPSIKLEQGLQELITP